MTSLPIEHDVIRARTEHVAVCVEQGRGFDPGERLARIVLGRRRLYLDAAAVFGDAGVVAVPSAPVGAGVVGSVFGATSRERGGIVDLDHLVRERAAVAVSALGEVGDVRADSVGEVATGRVVAT